MYIDEVPNRNSPPAYPVRESYRDENGKVKKRTLANVSFLKPEQLEPFRAVLRGATVADTPLEDLFELLATTPHGHVAAILGTMRRMGLPALLGRGDSSERRTALALIAGGILSPGSKLALSRHLTGKATTLADRLGLPGDLDEDDLYHALRWLGERQERIQNSLAKRHLEEGTIVLYDLSSSYYGGTTCELAKRGYNRDGRKGKTQINYGLLTTAEGRPIAIEVYPGNTSDPATVGDQIQTMREKSGIRKAIIVGDRGLLTSRQLELAAEDPGLADYGWISALRSSALSKLVENKDLQPELFDQRDLAEIQSDEYPGERLIACRSPALAGKRDQTRQSLLKATGKALDEIVAAVRREKAPYKGKDRIARRIEREASRHKMLEHYKLDIGEGSFSYRRDEEKIREEARQDGFYIVRARNVSEGEMTAEQLVGTYKSLGKVESAFRRIKTTSLEVRPIFHHESEMVRAHIFLCMLAYGVQWEMERKLAPLLFREEDKEAAGKKRRSPVSPAQRSDIALEKERTKKTAGEEKLPVHGFRSLIENLGSLGEVTCRAKVKGAGSFVKYAQATELQQEAHGLLGILTPQNEKGRKK